MSKPIHQMTGEELHDEEVRLTIAVRSVGELPSTPERRLLWRKLMDRADTCKTERRRRHGMQRDVFELAERLPRERR